MLHCKHNGAFQEQNKCMLSPNDSTKILHSVCLFVSELCFTAKSKGTRPALLPLLTLLIINVQMCCIKTLVDLLVGIRLFYPFLSSKSFKQPTCLRAYSCLQQWPMGACENRQCYTQRHS